MNAARRKAVMPVSMCDDSYTRTFAITLALVKEGRIHEDRIDLSVSRILRLKFELGSLTIHITQHRLNRVGDRRNKAKALEAARESIVLMKKITAHFPAPEKVKSILVMAPWPTKGHLQWMTLRWIPNDEASIEEMSLSLVAAEEYGNMYRWLLHQRS